ncbi:MAG TPA: DUF5995 family protein [Micromonosporaceae bacterium]|nr:DUF5995 family protein [Micromonosporaceae bacterium]
MTEPTWGHLQQEMTAVLAGEPDDIAGVVQQLTALQDVLKCLPPMYEESPIADFNKLYTTITRRIYDRHQAGDFADSAFLNRLDVEFARRYIDALRRWSTADPATPESWRVLFCRVADTRLRSLPCAVTGVNAHINYDLPFALVATWERLGHAPDGSRQHHDYLLVNEVFEQEIPGLRRGYLVWWQQHLDRINMGFDDWYQNLLVELTRDLAWDRAQKLWRQRSNPTMTERLRTSFDTQTALVGSALLSPLCAFLQ